VKINVYAILVNISKLLAKKLDFGPTSSSEQMFEAPKLHFAQIKQKKVRSQFGNISSIVYVGN